MTPLRIMSWNIKQLAGKSVERRKYTRNPHLVCGLEDIAVMAGAITGGRGLPDDPPPRLPDVLIVLEVMPDGGAIGLGQIAARTGLVATETTLNASVAGDKYGLLYNPRTVEFVDQLWPSSKRDDRTLPADIPFPDRVPTLFRLRAHASQQVFDVIGFHGPNPRPPYIARSALPQLAQMPALTSPRPTILCGDFNVDFPSAPYGVFDTIVTQPSPQAPPHAVPWLTALINAPTSLSTLPPPGPYRANTYDNFFVPAAWVHPQYQGPGKVVQADVFDFVALWGNSLGMLTNQASPDWAALFHDLRYYVSDHLPIWMDVWM